MVMVGRDSRRQTSPTTTVPLASVQSSRDSWAVHCLSELRHIGGIDQSPLRPSPTVEQPRDARLLEPLVIGINNDLFDGGQPGVGQSQHLEHEFP